MIVASSNAFDDAEIDNWAVRPDTPVLAAVSEAILAQNVLVLRARNGVRLSIAAPTMKIRPACLAGGADEAAT